MIKVKQLLCSGSGWNYTWCVFVLDWLHCAACALPSTNTHRLHSEAQHGAACDRLINKTLSFYWEIISPLNYILSSLSLWINGSIITFSKQWIIIGISISFKIIEIMLFAIIVQPRCKVPFLLFSQVFINQAAAEEEEEEQDTHLWRKKRKHRAILNGACLL